MINAEVGIVAVSRLWRDPIRLPSKNSVGNLHRKQGNAQPIERQGLAM
jgi:hypothetical protein